MNQRFNIISDTVIMACFNEIVRRRDNGEQVSVIVTDKSETRTQAQNRLYWQWITVIANHLGNDKDYQHIYFKRYLLAKIYARDDGEFALMASSIKNCQGKIPYAQYEAMANGVAKQISTTTATTAQFMEYLNDIEKWAYAKAIYLPIPDDLRWVRE